MKSFLSIIVMVLIPCFALQYACATKPAPATGESPALYILHQSGGLCEGAGEASTVPASRKYAIEQLNAALDGMLGRPGDASTIILYVHGRAAGEEKEPNKSLKQVVPCLERENAAHVLMFYWPGSSECGPLGFPEDQARQAAPSLGQVLAGLQRYKKENTARVQHHKFVLLLHSMGNIVFEEFLRSYGSGSLQRDLFDTVVLSASATSAKGHAEWLQKNDFTSHLYVTVNENDPVIDKLGVRERRGRLGKKLTTFFGGPVPLAANALYVDIGRAGIDTHRYFLKSGQKKNPDLAQFFHSVLRGEAFPFDRFSAVEDIKQRDDATIYYFKHR